MTETEIRLRAALTEMQALHAATAERCINLAAELAVVNARLAEAKKAAESKDQVFDPAE